MHRIDGPGATPAHQFTDGDPVSGIPATVVTDDFLNAVQEEIAAVIEATGAALNKPTNTQLLTAIRRLVRTGSPVGQVIVGYFPIAPAGYLSLAGQLVPRTAYSDLWAYVSGSGLVVAEAAWSSAWTMFSSGDGASNFRLPDLRGEFIRSWDNERGVDGGRTLGSWQADQNKAHSHGMSNNFTRALASGNVSSPGGGLVSIGASGVPGTTDTSGGTEARPRGVALHACIAY